MTLQELALCEAAHRRATRRGTAGRRPSAGERGASMVGEGVFFGMATAQTTSGSGGDCAGVGSGRMDRAAGCCRWLLCRPVGDGAEAEAGDVDVSNSGRRRREQLEAAAAVVDASSSGRRDRGQRRPTQAAQVATGWQVVRRRGRRGGANSDGQSTEMKP
jgi:hypothetical protein